VSHSGVDVKQVANDSGGSVTKHVGGNVDALLVQPFKHRVQFSCTILDFCKFFATTHDASNCDCVFTWIL